MASPLEHIVASMQAHGVTPFRLALGFSVFTVSLIGSIVAVAVVLVRLPPTYFVDDDHAKLRLQPGWKGLARTVGKNLLGVALVVLGIILALPGIPGQGVLTALIGVVLLDIPGKRKFERRIIRIRGVHDAVNRLRARYHRAPLEV